MSISMYVVIENHGVWEVIRVDDSRSATVVQTNIYTYEKARLARRDWQERELLRHG